MAEKMPIRIREVIVVAADGTAYVKSDIVPSGEIWCIQGLAYENETGARGDFRRYIEGHGYDHHLIEHHLADAGELIFSEQALYLIPGERLVVRQAGCSASDVLALYAHGYKTHSKFIDEVGE